LLVGQKKPLQPKHVWSIRVRLEISRKWRDLALFNLAIDSKLRPCDSVKLRLDEVCSGAKVRDRATIVTKKTGRPVQFEITEQTRVSLEAWLRTIRTTGCRYLFPSRLHASSPIHTTIRWREGQLSGLLRSQKRDHGMHARAVKHRSYRIARRPKKADPTKARLVHSRLVRSCQPEDGAGSSGNSAI